VERGPAWQIRTGLAVRQFPAVGPERRGAGAVGLRLMSANLATHDDCVVLISALAPPAVKPV
jgi:hypothetical protein